MQYRLNRQSLEKARNLVREGRFTNDPFTFTADDANALLGLDPNKPGSGNWTEYRQWFLGYSTTKADPAIDDGQVPDKTWTAYPFGKNGELWLNALRAIIKDATAVSEMDIADAAEALLMDGLQRLIDQKSATGVESDPPPAENPTYSMSASHAIIGTAFPINIQAKSPGANVPTFEMDAYTGGPMKLNGWSHPVVVDLDGIEGINKPRPIFRDHDGSKIAGHANSIEVTPDYHLKVSGVMSGVGHPHADEIINSAKNGFRWGASIGANTIENEFVPKGQTAKANGKTWPGPINIARRTSLGEVSFVALGADENASASIAASAKPSFLKTTPHQQIHQHSAVPASKGSYMRTTRTNSLTVPVIAAAAARAWNVPERYAFADLSEQECDQATDRRIRENVDSITGLMELVAKSNGIPLPGNRRNNIRAWYDIMQAIEIKNRMDFEVQADGGGTGGVSTVSLSGLVENIANKAAMAGFGMVSNITPYIAYENDTNDFRLSKRYRVTAAGVAQALAVSGELHSISLQDESYSVQAKTQGVLLNLGRDIWINDDMGALTAQPTQLGRGAALYMQMILIANYLGLPGILATGTSPNQKPLTFNFISAGAGNYASGAGSALSDSAMATATKNFLEQTDANGMPLMLEPGVTLVPPALRSTANGLYGGASMIVSALANNSSGNDTSANFGKHQIVVSPFLSATIGAKLAKYFTRTGESVMSNYANASDTQWSLLPTREQIAGGLAPLQVAYVRGQRTPIVEVGKANFNLLAMAIRCYWDWGISAHDWRSIAWQAGQ